VSVILTQAGPSSPQTHRFTHSADKKTAFAKNPSLSCPFAAEAGSALFLKRCIVFLDQGRLLAEGDPKTILSDPALAAI